MPLKDQVANYARRIVERAPDEDRLRELARPGRLALLRFSDDGIVPNNPRLPVLLYRKAVRFLKPYKNATVVDGLFALNGWGRSWRNGVYDFVHYHSQVHEALGIATGECRLELGGLKGRTLNLSAGDVVVLPAGTGHRLIDASRNSAGCWRLSGTGPLRRMHRHARPGGGCEKNCRRSAAEMRSGFWPAGAAADALVLLAATRLRESALTCLSGYFYCNVCARRGREPFCLRRIYSPRCTDALLALQACRLLD